LFGTLEWIHRGIWLSTGNIVMGLGAVTLIFLLGSLGVYLWWPRKPRRFIQGFTLNGKLKGPAFNIGLHRTIGGWVAIPLAISALTGLPNAFDSVHDAITALDGSREAKHLSQLPSSGGEKLPLARAWETITRLTSTPTEVLIHVARAPKDPLQIYIIEKGAPHANARSYLYLDAYSGKILSFVPYSQMGFGSRIYFWMLSLHTAEVGGLAGQLVLFAGALGALILGYTGLSAYVRRRFKLDKKRPRKPVIMPARAGMAEPFA
jgi:vanillate O-demethylase ferredoxin subunit